MAKKEGQTIVIKKVMGGHGAAHGGAWKVAYADFVTAMMAFFLVLWLLGSDEEVRSSIETYFSTPPAAWRLDIFEDRKLALGERTGEGESILSGLEGETPYDKNRDIVMPVMKEAIEGSDAIPPNAKLSDTLRKLPISVNAWDFAIPERALFKAGTEELNPDGMKLLREIGEVFRDQKGFLEIISTTDKTIPYEFKLSRAVAVGNFLVKQHYLSEDRVKEKVTEVENLPGDGIPRLEFRYHSSRQ